MLEKQIVTGKIEILPDGQIQIRTDTVILEDGIELSRTYHRSVLSPNDDTSKHDERVQAVAELIWTPDVIKAHKDRAIDTPLSKLKA